MKHIETNKQNGAHMNTFDTGIYKVTKISNSTNAGILGSSTTGRWGVVDSVTNQPVLGSKTGNPYVYGKRKDAFNICQILSEVKFKGE